MPEDRAHTHDSVSLARTEPGEVHRVKILPLNDPFEIETYHDKRPEGSVLDGPDRVLEMI